MVVVGNCRATQENRPDRGTARQIAALMWIAALLLGAITSIACAAGRLCDTPVYRYALYRWSPSPYLIVAFTGTAPDAGRALDRAEQRVIKALQAQEPANGMWVRIDPDGDAAVLETLPPALREAVEARKPTPHSEVWLVNPRGQVVDRTPASKLDLPKWFDSPARRAVRKQIEQDKVGVFVLLESPDHPDKNKAAWKTIEQAINEIQSGKIKLHTAPSVTDPEVGVVRLARDDPAEQAFVRQLLLLEPDLGETKGPIVFLVFGRGRALFSCLGKGIRVDNLARDVEFVSGACSCTVKDQNPGLDLLMPCDWESVAAIVAEAHEGEEGSEAVLGGEELFPELAMPAGEAEVTRPADPVESDDAHRANGADGSVETTGSSSGNDAQATNSGFPVKTDSTTEPADPTARAGDEGPSGIGPASGRAGEPEQDRQEAGKAEPVAASDRPKGTSSTHAGPSSATARVADAGRLREDGPAPAPPSAGLARIVIGIGIVLVVLFAATWLVLKPRR